MDVLKANENPLVTQPLEAAAERSADLAEARHRVSAAQIDAWKVAKVRRAELIAESHDAISEALGANTRISIARSRNQQFFVYRAIDVSSGEIVREWPLDRFADFINALRPGAIENLAGFIVDREA